MLIYLRDTPGDYEMLDISITSSIITINHIIDNHKFTMYHNMDHTIEDAITYLSMSYHTFPKETIQRLIYPDLLV